MHYKRFNSITGTNSFNLPAVFNELLIIVQGAGTAYNYYSTVVPKEAMSGKTTYWRFGNNSTEITVQLNDMSVKLDTVKIDNADYTSSSIIHLYYR